MYSDRSPCSPQEVRELACKAAFGGFLITNNFRGLVAEAIVASTLGPEWSWCSADYAGWDFVRADGIKLEVKQSAAKQTWVRTGGAPSACSFDIRSRKGRYEGAEWFDEPGRSADIYVFAHHNVADETADHCNPQQWQFYVVLTSALPAWKRIGIANIRKLATSVPASELRNEVERVAQRLSSEGPVQSAFPPNLR